MRDVEHDHGHGVLAQLKHLLELALLEVVGAVECDRCRQQVDVVGGLAHQAVQHGLVDLLVGRQRIGNAVRRILVEVEAGCAESQVHVEDKAILAQSGGDCPGHVVRNGGTACATLGGDETNGAADRSGILGGEEIGDGADDLLGGGRQHDILGNARTDQFAIQQHVVDVTQYHDTGRGVADVGETLKRTGNLIGVQRSLNDDQIGGRIGLIALDRAIDAAIMRGKRDLGHAPVMNGALDQLRGLGMFAKGLDGDARNEARARRDVGGGLFNLLGL
jgi:hypothetical protein